MRISTETFHTTYTGTVKDHEIELEISFTVCDCGIGSYEFWGERGCDQRMGLNEYWADSAQLISRSGESSRDIDPESVWVERLLDQWADSEEWEREVEDYE